MPPLLCRSLDGWLGAGPSPVGLEIRRIWLPGGEGWSVAELTQFLEQKDLRGLAKHLRANGVRGVDPLNMDAHALVSEVGLTKFAASRVVSVRDAFL